MIHQDPWNFLRIICIMLYVYMAIGHIQKWRTNEDKIVQVRVFRLGMAVFLIGNTVSTVRNALLFVPGSPLLFINLIGLFILLVAHEWPRIMRINDRHLKKHPRDPKP